MDERFKADYEKDVNHDKLFKVKYSGNVLQYIDDREALNGTVGISGITWRKILKDGLSTELWQDLAKVRGGVPEEDDAVIVAIKKIGLAHERFLREEKLRGNSQGGQDSGQKKGNKRKRGPKEDSGAQGEDSAPPAKKPQKGKGKDSGSGDTKPRFTKDQMDDALKGIPPNLREAREKKGMCKRCGLDNHRWQWCRKEISISSTRKKEKKKDSGDSKGDKETAPAASSVILKRKAPENTVSVGVHPITYDERILANLWLKARDSKRIRTASGVKAEESRRLFEINSEDEEMM